MAPVPSCSRAVGRLTSMRPSSSWAPPGALALGVNRDGSKIAVDGGGAARLGGGLRCSPAMANADGPSRRARIRLPEFEPPVNIAWTDDDLVLLALDLSLHVFDADLEPLGKRPILDAFDIDFVDGMLALGDRRNGIAVPWQMVYVLRGGMPMGNAPPPYDFTWAFIICDQADGTCRLVVRERYGYSRRWAALLVEPVEAISFIMSRRMLPGIKQRAERAARPLPS